MATPTSDSMSSASNKVIYCRFHRQEPYQLYCKDCNGLVCFECLQDKHYKHGVCRLRDSENDLRICLQTELLEKNEMLKLNEQIGVELNNLTKKKTDLLDEMKTEADRMKTKIDLSKETVLENISSTFDGYVSTINLNQRFKSLKEKTTEENIRKYDFWQLVEILVEWREILEIISAISHFTNSIKIEKTSCEFSIGTIVTVEKSSDKCEESTHVKSFRTTFTQTERVEETENEEDEWFDADDKVDEDDLIEYSSDVETQLERLPVVIKMTEDIKHIGKIIPVSEKSAWILSDRKLRFIKEHFLEEKIYATDIDDIAVLKNGNVLLLCQTESFIMQLLPNNEIVRFASADRFSAMPKCLIVSQTEDVIVVSSSKPSKPRSSCSYEMKVYIFKMSKNGVLTKENDFIKQDTGPPCAIADFQSQICLIYQNYYCTNGYFLEVIKVSTGKTIWTYNGSIGSSPSRNFECYGICLDNSNNLLVSDFRHHCVYLLDNELKFKKCVKTCTDGLHGPKAVALWKNSLWIADKQQIFKFFYDPAESLLHA